MTEIGNTDLKADCSPISRCLPGTGLQEPAAYELIWVASRNGNIQHGRTFMKLLWIRFPVNE
jgi:hypothetical protein